MATETRRIQFEFTARDRGVGRALDDVADSAEETNDRLSGMGEQGTQSAGKLTKGLGMVTAALGAAGVGVATFGAALMKGLDGEAATAKLAAQLGLTKDESARIGKDAGRIYSQAYGESMDEVKASIKSVIQNMDGMRTASSADLQATTKRAMDLATVMEEDVGNVTRSVSQMMRTGLAKNSAEAFDILTRGAQLGADKAQDLLDTFNEYGTQFRKLGLDGKTAMGIITQGLQAGARDADIVADAIKEFSIRAVDGSTTTADGFKAIGLSADEMSGRIGKGGKTAADALDLTLDRLRAIEDPVKRSQAAVALFGTQAEDLGDSLFKLDPSQAVKRLGDLKGATDRAGKAMGDTLKAKLTGFKRTVETNITGFLESKALPALEKFGESLRRSGRSPENIRMANQLREAWGKLGGFLKTSVMPALRDMWSWWSTKIMPVIQKMHREVLSELVKQLQKVGEEIDKPELKEFAKNAAMIAEKVYKVLGPALAWVGKVVLKGLGLWISLSIKSYRLIAAEFNRVVDGVRKYGPEWLGWLKKIGQGATKMKDVGVSAFRTMARIFLDAVSKIVGGAARAFGWVPGLGGKLKAAAKKVDDFKNDTNRSLDKLSKGKVVPIKIKATTTGGAAFEIGKGFVTRAKGGPIPHTGPGASEAYDSVPALLRVNEHVWTPEEVRGMGGHDKVFKLRQMARQGLLQGFEKGGPVGGFSVSAQVPSKGDMQRGVWGPINSGIAGLIRAMAKELAKLYAMFGGAGGVVAAARKWLGTPYSWGGGGKGGPSLGIGRGASTVGFDCSGLTEYAWWQGARQSIGGVTYTQHPASRPIGGPRPGALGFNASLGHVALASDKPGYVIEAPYTGSFVREVRKSMPDWRWPKGAKFAAGGPVRKLGLDVTDGFAQRAEIKMARLAGIAGSRGAGGPVGAGLPYLVGEYGAEVHVPRAAGRIERSGTTVVYQNNTVNVQVGPTANLAEVGRKVNDALAEFKRKGGKVVTGSG